MHCLSRLWTFYEGRDYLLLGTVRRIGRKFDDITSATGETWFQRLAGLSIGLTMLMVSVATAVFLYRGPLTEAFGDITVFAGMALAERANELSRIVLPAWNALAGGFGLRPGRPLELDSEGGLLAGLVLLFAFLVAGLVGRAVRGKWGPNAEAARSRSTMHGAADWMSSSRANEIYGGGGGIVIGHLGSPAIPRKLLTYDGRTGTGQAMVFANTGAGKTAAIGIPTALTWCDPLVYLDPSGEVAAVTAGYRRRLNCGRKVVVLAPGNGHGVNILDWIDPAREAEAVNKIQTVGNWFADLRARVGENSFFEHRAVDLIRCMVAGVIFDPELDAEERTIAEVHWRLTRGWDWLMECLTRQSHWAHGCGFPASEARINLDEAQKAARTFAGVHSGALTKLSWVADPLLAPLASGDSVKLAELVSGNLDIFINLRPRDLEAHPGCARALVGALMNAVYEGGCDTNRRTLFLLDEISKLGRMAEISTAMFDGRKYGVSIVGLWQNIGQLRDLYGRELADSWLGASQYIQFFGVGDPQTAELVEKLCGTYTAIERSVSQRGLGLDRRDRNQSRRQVPRALIRADEALKLSKDKAIVFNKGLPPIRCTLARYFEHPALRALGDDNPFVRHANTQGAAPPPNSAQEAAPNVA
jgi:type IV secretion system protein VirD4